VVSFINYLHVATILVAGPNLTLWVHSVFIYQTKLKPCLKTVASLWPVQNNEHVM